MFYFEAGVFLSVFRHLPILHFDLCQIFILAHFLSMLIFITRSVSQQMKQPYFFRKQNKTGRDKIIDVLSAGDMNRSNLKLK